MESTLWNTVLSCVMGLGYWFIKVIWGELRGAQMLLNKTREDVLRNNITRDELEKMTSVLDQRLNKIENKIDTMMQIFYQTTKINHEQENIVAYRR